MARLVDEGFVRTIKGPAEFSQMYDTNFQIYYAATRGTSNNESFLWGLASAVFSFFFNFGKTGSAISIAAENMVEIINSASRNQKDAMIDGAEMCRQLKQFCYDRDIINLDLSMYYYEFQTVDGRRTKYPKGNPGGDNAGKAYQIHRMQLSNGQWMNFG